MTDEPESFKTEEQKILWFGIAAPMRDLHRRAAEPTHDKIAEQAELSVGTVGNIFNARRRVSSENVVKVATVLGGDREEWNERWVKTSEELKALNGGPAIPPPNQDQGPGDGSELADRSLDQKESGQESISNPDTGAVTQTIRPEVHVRELARIARQNRYRIAAILAAILAVFTAGVFSGIWWFEEEGKKCATVTARPSAPVYLEIGQQPPFKTKRYGEQVELYLALEPTTTSDGTYRAVRIREGRNTYGWILDTQITQAPCAP